MKFGPTTFQWMCFSVSDRSIRLTSRSCSRSATSAPSSRLRVGTVKLAWRVELTREALPRGRRSRAAAGAAPFFAGALLAAVGVALLAVAALVDRVVVFI